ncbi:Nitroreductase family protein [Enhygromyxa salina]|uniref:Nitroreductase family protein n=2 Tax=Enhygromyxa salina TaxID=215803 RepID=A0A2S9YT76_9BACT|nr:Nitroreductase family protein [Enhygromyxa salina]
MVRDLILAGRSRHEHAEPSAPTDRPGELAPAIPLPLPVDADPACDLRSVIASRRSTSLRDSGSLPLSQLSLLLRNAEIVDAGPLCPDARLRAQLFVVALDVPPLEPAVYRYDHAGHQLVLVEGVAREQLRAEVLLQHDQGDAAALVFVVTPLARWLRMHADRGYRGAMMSVGWVIDSLYLQAAQLGLQYSATGGFALARANELLQLDGYEYTTALAFAVGAGASALEEPG